MYISITYVPRARYDKAGDTAYVTCHMPEFSPYMMQKRTPAWNAGTSEPVWIFFLKRDGRQGPIAKCGQLTPPGHTKSIAFSTPV